MSDDTRELYEHLIGTWNDRDAEAMSSLFAPAGIMIGFDGSLVTGVDAVREHLTPIFADHPTAAYVTIVRSVQSVGDGATLLLADAGMVPPGQTEITPMPTPGRRLSPPGPWTAGRSTCSRTPRPPCTGTTPDATR